MTTKPIRGTCATCHWWEFSNVFRAPNGDEVRNGLCLVNPPVPIMTVAQAARPIISAAGQQQTQVTAGVQGMVPPTTEFGRCSKWQAVATFPEVSSAN